MRSTDFHVIVAGGGISGTMAAIASSREGAKTLLLERYAALGGMGTLGLVQPITTWGVGGHYVIAGTGKRVLSELTADSPGRCGNTAGATPLSHYGPVCDAEYLKFHLERWAGEYDVHLRYHSWVCGVDRTRERITALNVVSKGGPAALRARVFVDATGDADVAAYAGVPFDVGSQGISLMFLVAGIDFDQSPPPAEITRLYGEHRVGYRGLAMFRHPRPDSAYFNVTEVEGLDALDPCDLTKATVECRRQAWEILSVMRRHVAGFENAFIAQTAPALGVRESRRIRGRYILTVSDAENGVHFDDVIARASCPVDIHGSADDGLGEYRTLNRSYAVPYRCLITDKIDNLIVTGRSVSADHGAHSSLRRMAPGFALGEAAGIAAAHAAQSAGARGGAETSNVRTIDLTRVQRTLRGYGAVLDPEPTTTRIGGQ